jgi:hypothetical protein
VRRRFADGPALLAATLIAFLPDVLAHGGVAYNDLPLALAFLIALFVTDAAIRKPSWRSGLLAGAAMGVALGVKISAIALAPIALLLLGLEFAQRRKDAAWLRQIGPAAVFTLAGVYLALVLIFRGDFDLGGFRYGLDFRYRHFSGGHGTNAYLLGQLSPTGWWYFFPVAFLFKTSAGLHLLMLCAWIGFALRLRTGWRDLASSHLRAPVIGLLVFGTVLLRSNLNIGFRYALPVLPLLCIITAVGVFHFWPHAARAVRALLVAAVVWLIVQPLSYYPFFLAYVSEYGPGRERNHEVLIDSSLDWGQNLLELRKFMRAHDIPRVYLSYFGSGSPGAYGIDYVPLQSFFALPPRAPQPGQPDPEWVVVSASLLRGSYTVGDPFQQLREVPPDAVIGYSMLAWHMRR